jgi:hypothetical protein
LISDKSDIIGNVRVDARLNAIVVRSQYRHRNAAIREVRQAIDSGALHAADILHISLEEAMQLVEDGDDSNAL